MRSLALVAVLSLAACDADSPVGAVSDGPGRAAEFRSAAVTEAVSAAAEVVQTRGFAPTDGGHRGFLVEDTAEASEASMRSGSCYVALAAGSAALRELELAVYDADGVEVATDAHTGPHAAVLFCPTQTGIYYLTLRASAGSGLYELRTFRGPTGLTIGVDDLFREPALRQPAREGR